MASPTCDRRRVKVLLAERDERQCDVAAELRVTPEVLSKVVTGQVASWPALRARMAAYFDVPEHELFPRAVDL